MASVLLGLCVIKWRLFLLLLLLLLFVCCQVRAVEAAAAVAAVAAEKVLQLGARLELFASGPSRREKKREFPSSKNKTKKNKIKWGRFFFAFVLFRSTSLSFLNNNNNLRKWEEVNSLVSRLDSTSCSLRNEFNYCCCCCCCSLSLRLR